MSVRAPQYLQRTLGTRCSQPPLLRSRAPFPASRRRRSGVPEDARGLDVGAGPTLHESETRADSVSFQAGGPGRRAADLGVLVGAAGPAVHFAGHIGELDLGKDSSTMARRLASDAGSSMASRGLTTTRSAPSRCSMPKAGSVSRAKASHAWSRWVFQVSGESSSARVSTRRR